MGLITSGFSQVGVIGLISMNQTVLFLNLKGAYGPIKPAYSKRSSQKAFANSQARLH